MSTIFKLGTIVGGTWKIGKLIGTGCYGSVFDVKNGENNQVGVIKVNKKPSITEFEVKLLRMVSGRVGHQKMLQSGEHRGIPYVIMQKEGKSLASLTEHHDGNLPTNKLLLILHCLIQGLEVLHGLHILHRDISPENILLSNREDSPVVLIDMGMSGLIRADGTVEECTTTHNADYPYGSPALRQDEKFEYKDDVFSIILVLLESTSCSPFIDGSINYRTLVKIADNDASVPMPCTTIRNLLYTLKVNNRTPPGTIPKPLNYVNLLAIIQNSRSFDCNIDLDFD